MEVIITILIFRLLTPFLVIRWPFWGSLAIIFVDTFDFTALNYFNINTLNPESYQSFDKAFDLYGLFFQLYTVRYLREVKAKKILKILFSWRLIGVVLFELTKMRQLLFFAPNIFEYFYLLIFGSKKFFPSFSLEENKNLYTLLIIATLPKITFEYILHFKEYPLGFGRIWDLIRNKY